MQQKLKDNSVSTQHNKLYQMVGLTNIIFFNRAIFADAIIRVATIRQSRFYPLWRAT